MMKTYIGLQIWRCIRGVAIRVWGIEITMAEVIENRIKGRKEGIGVVVAAGAALN